MEPSDLDQIIKSKLQETNDIHRHEKDSAKPFVWSAVQRNLEEKRGLRWYHLAAAVFLLLIGFSFVLYSFQQKHEKELTLLSNKIDQFEQGFQAREVLLESKEGQLRLMDAELNDVRLQLANLQRPPAVAQKEKIVFLTDTVFIKQVEYVNENPVIASKQTAKEERNIQNPNVKREHSEFDQAIFPSYVGSNTSQKSEAIKVKFLRASRN